MDVQNQTEVLRGTVENITYQNEFNSYTVCTVKSGRELVTVVGTLPFLHEGEQVEFLGNYIVHQTYGQQFSATSFTHLAPENAAAILKYLSSGVIKGVGPSTANKIVKKFGEDTLDIIKNNPAELATIKGITIEKAYSISEEYCKQYSVRDIMLLLSPYNVSVEMCVRIYRKLHDEACEIIKRNPYVLCQNDIGFSFPKAEDIAQDLGLPPDNKDRLLEGILYVLRRNLLNGHTCLPAKKLIEVASGLLEADSDKIGELCNELKAEMRISEDYKGDKLFYSLPEYSASECYIAARLRSVKENIDNTIPVADLEIDRVENKLGIKFQSLQREAIKQAMESGVLILTGGPGTGKTTTLNAIIELFENRNALIELAAPTGRAAKRMSELTGREAKTIHRMLEVEWGEEDKQTFSRNEKNPLDCEVLIVDEASMIDARLFENLLRALRSSCRIILVGDTDQLPSVSAGNVLGDMLDSGVFPSIALKKVFRQAGKSLIVTNAHAIIDGEKLNLTDKKSDFFFIRRFENFEVLSTVTELCAKRLPKAYGFNPLSDIQVLCPSKKSDTGTVSFNNILQAELNPKDSNAPKVNFKGFSMYEGDKVMQIKNNYDLEWIKDNGEMGIGVYNGDIGFIEKIDIRGGFLKIRFDDRVATYFTENLGEIELAYAVTVHKSQGSEYDCVVLPLMDIPSKLKYRNLLYTAVTRAKKLLVIVGSESEIYEMQANNKKTLRYTLLKDFLEASNG
ncbi:MAG: ATP-dependent RecD-like DNA helicase [Ruminococcaceae bacterium]|nr:ATP-dependent RecD-like DNA helicase [Oscillospiraceae bacterium]